MKKNRLKLLPIFLTFPFLMGNAPIPQVFTDNYTKFDLTFISEEKTAEEKYKQHFTLNNKGDGYISRVYLDDNYDVDFYGSYIYEYQPHAPFTETLFEPGFNGEIVLSSFSKMPDVKKIKRKAEGYTNFVKDLKFDGTKEITLEHEPSSSDTSLYQYTIDLAINLPDTHYNYGVILKLEYEGDTCYIAVSKGLGYRFETSEKLDLEKVNVADIIGIKSEPYLTHQFGCSGDLSGALTVALIIFIVFALFMSFGIFAAIFFPAMARRRRKRRLALQQQKEQNEKESQ